MVKKHHPFITSTQEGGFLVCGYSEMCQPETLFLWNINWTFP